MLTNTVGNDDDLENGNSKNATEFQEDIESSIPLTVLLCCVHSKFVKIALVTAPTILFTFLFILNPTEAPPVTPAPLFITTAAPDATTAAPIVLGVNLPLLLASILPIALYILGWISLALVIYNAQVNRDDHNAVAAQKYLERLENNANSSNVFGMLLHAARLNNTEGVNWCLAKDGCDPDQADSFGRTALHWAAMKGSDDVVDILIKVGASIDQQDTLDSLSPLHYGCFYGNLTVVRMLVDAGANVTAESKSRLNPLQLAEMASLRTSTVQPSHRLIIKYLRLSMGAEATEPMENICGLTVLKMLERCQ